MDFDFNDEQNALRDQVARFLSEQSVYGVSRQILDNGASYAQELWQQIIAQGYLGTAIPEQYGGVGFSYIELCVLAEELGRVSAPVPFSSTVYLAAEAILQAGNEEQKQKWLPKITAGEIIATLALAENVGPVTPKSIHTVFDGEKITGIKWPVVDGDIANLIIVLAKLNDEPTLVLVES